MKNRNTFHPVLIIVTLLTLLLPTTLSSARGTAQPAASQASSSTASGPANSPWPMYQHDAQRTSRSLYVGPSQPYLKWHYSISPSSASSPSIAPDGTIYVGGIDEQFHAIRPDGTSKWTYAVPSRIGGSPAIADDGTVYVGHEDYSTGSLMAFNPDGSLEWSYPARGVRSSPAIAPDGTIYVGASNARLYAINPNGSLKWEYQPGFKESYSSPAIGSDGTIYVAGCKERNIHAVNPDGTTKWTYPIGTTGDTISSPTIDSDGTIYIGGSDNKLYALNPNGTLKWVYYGGAAVNDYHQSAAIGPDGSIYFISYAGVLWAFDPARGILKWTYSIGAGAIKTTPTVDANGTIYFGARNGKVYAINPDGSEKWTFQTPADALGSTIAINSDGTLYVSGSEGVYAIGGSGAPDTTLVYDGPLYLPLDDDEVIDEIMPGESDRRITMGDHVRLSLPFKNKSSQPLSNVTVKVVGKQSEDASISPSVSLYDESTSWWASEVELQLSPTTISPGESGSADFWIYVSNPIDREALYGGTRLQLQTDTGHTWTVLIRLDDISFNISGNEDLKSSSCLHNPDTFPIQRYAQYAAGGSVKVPPTNEKDPDTPEQAIRNLVSQVRWDFRPAKNAVWATRMPDIALLITRGGTIGICRDYADLTTGLLRSLGFPARYISATAKEPGFFSPTFGHAWVEAYLGEAEWRQVDSSYSQALNEGYYEQEKKWTVKKVWADNYPLSSASKLRFAQNRCISTCYEEPVDCPSCLRESDRDRLGLFPDTSCVTDATSNYHNVGAGDATVAAASDERLLIHLQAPTFVTRTVPFTLTSGVVNSTTLSLGAITATVVISEYVDSTAPLFDAAPPYQVTTNVAPGQTVTFTWVITPLVTGSSIPLGVAAESGDFFEAVEQPLVANEPGTLPDLTLGGMCSIDTISPGEAVTLTAYALDKYLQPLVNTATLISATVYATPTLLFSTTVNLPYCEMCEMYQSVVSLPETAPIGNYQADFVTTRPGYDPDTRTTFFFVNPDLDLSLSANLDTLDMRDTLTLTAQVSERTTVITNASVRVEVETPTGAVTAPLMVEGGNDYVLTLRPLDLAANLDKQVLPGTWLIRATADYRGSEASTQKTIVVRTSIYLPLVLRNHRFALSK
jgi:outer membrane protein assembly factor BamB